MSELSVVSRTDNISDKKYFTAVIERCTATGFYVGSVPGFSGAYTQGRTVEELESNLKEVIEMLLEEGDVEFSSHFIGTKTIAVEDHTSIEL